MASTAGNSFSVSFALRALRHRNYRLYFLGQGTSLAGTWLTRAATSWMVYRITSSERMLGIIGFAGQIPTFILAPLAGVLMDRWNRRRTLLATQFILLLVAAALAFFALRGTITAMDILYLSIIQGVANAFDMPARQAFLVDIIEDREDLGNAIALNSSMVNATRVIGPTAAGGIIAAVGEGFCFLIDAISYVAVLAALLMMKLKAQPKKEKQNHFLHDLSAGMRYAFGFAPIRSILMLMALVSLMGIPYMVLMPVFAKDILHGNAVTQGLLMGTSGVGALGGALYLASRRSVLGLGRVMAIASALFGVGLIGFGFSHWLWLSLLMMVVTGFAMIVGLAASNTILQTIVQDHMRGRIMSLWSMAFMGMAPLGSLLAGQLSEHYGAPFTVIVGGITCILGGAWFALQLPALRPLIRPIYIQRGIIREIANGAQTTTQLTTPPED
jgi:MFS family permease